jgi:hypothetical protein
MKGPRRPPEYALAAKIVKDLLAEERTPREATEFIHARLIFETRAYGARLESIVVSLMGSECKRRGL